MKDELKKIGLGDKEAEVYIYLLKNKSQTASEISKSTKINRSVVYSIIERMLNKGIISYVSEKSVKKFSANNPKFLGEFLKDKERTLKNILPELSKLKPEKKELVNVEIYREKQGALAVMKDIIREGKNYIAFGEDKPFQEIMGTLAEQYIRQLKEKKIHERLLAPEGQNPLLSKYSKVKYLPKNVKLPALTAIYGDKVAIAIFQKPYYTLVIKSKDLANSYRSIFESLWKIAK